MATTTLYCSRNDLIGRLTDSGVDYVADDDGDRVVSESERVDTLDRAITEAGTEIDQSLCPWIETLPIQQDDANRNEVLKRIAIDLAAERAAGRGGANPPTSFIEAADRARVFLERFRNGEERPCGVTYPGDGFESERRLLGSPKVANPTHAYGRRRW